ncbi:unnamed protein product [Camellia sinensis]
MQNRNQRGGEGRGRRERGRGSKNRSTTPSEKMNTQSCHLNGFFFLKVKRNTNYPISSLFWVNNPISSHHLQSLFLDFYFFFQTKNESPISTTSIEGEKGGGGFNTWPTPSLPPPSASSSPANPPKQFNATKTPTPFPSPPTSFFSIKKKKKTKTEIILGLKLFWV